jgi:dihydrofolate reductase
MFVAADEKETIGLEGGLPWYFPEDLKRFRRLTAGHAVIAGRATHESIVRRLGHPLPGRTTIVLTRQSGHRDTEEVRYRSGLEDGLVEAQAAERSRGGDEVFVIGGADVYVQALPSVDRVYLTRVKGTYAGDCRLPDGWLDGFALTEREPHEDYAYETYERA